MAAPAAQPHLPYATTIEAYGKGGFRFAGMSHRGSLLCLPDGVWPWPVTRPQDIDEAALALVFERAGQLDFFMIGAGPEPWVVPEPLRARFRDIGLRVDAMQTGPAVRTYNIVAGEGRRVGAGLIAVD